MRDIFVKSIIDIAKADKNVFLITGDLGFGVLKPYWDALPDQFINAGIAEQAMTGLAAGMALEGKTIFTYSIGNFPTMRCLEQIRNDAAYHNANVKIVSIGSGFAYGSLGMSHHATEDIAIMRAIPDVTVFSPGDPHEAAICTRFMYQTQGTCYLRLGRGGERAIHSTADTFEVGRGLKILDGEQIAIFASGGILGEARDAAISLRQRGMNPAVYSFPTIKPIDKALISECARNFDLIVTVEEHNIIGGFGGAVSEELAGVRGHRARQVRIGLEDVFSSVVGSQQYLRGIYGMSAERIVQRVLLECSEHSE